MRGKPSKQSEPHYCQNHHHCFLISGVSLSCIEQKPDRSKMQNIVSAICSYSLHFQDFRELIWEGERDKVDAPWELGSGSKGIPTLFPHTSCPQLGFWRDGFVLTWSQLPTCPRCPRLLPGPVAQLLHSPSQSSRCAGEVFAKFNLGVVECMCRFLIIWEASMSSILFLAVY